MAGSVTLMDPRRAPHWRSARAVALVDGGERPSRRRDDVWVHRLYRLLLDRQLCTTALDFHALAETYGALYWAHDLHTAEDLDTCNPTRAELEARLLTTQDDASIAARLATSPEVVEAYAACFFDVRELRQARGYLAHVVLGTAAHSGFQESDYATLWKFAAISGGPEVLEQMVDVVGSAWSGGNANDWYTEAIRSRLQHKAFVATMTLRPNNFNAPQVLETYIKLCEMGKADRAGAGGTSEAYIDAIDMALQAMPISLGRRSEDCDILTHCRTLGIEHDTTEQLQLRAGIQPEYPGGIPLEQYAFPVSTEAATEGAR